MTDLRTPSERPTLFTNERGGRLGPNGTQVGLAGTLTRNRVIAVLPLNGGPSLLDPALVLHDAGMSYLADPQGNLIGEHNATRVSRILPATVTLDTRRL